MPFTCGVGKGKHPDVHKAAAQAAQQVSGQLGRNKPDLLLVLASVYYRQQQLIADLGRHFPGVPLIGCSTAGEIFNREPDEHSVVVAGLCGIQSRRAAGGNLADGSESAGRELGGQLAGSLGKLVLVFSDGLAGDGAAVLRGLQTGIARTFPWIGGAAGDDYLYQKTYQFLDGQVLSGSVIGAQLDGDFHFGVGVRHGWQPVGLPVTVTRAQGNQVIEINRLPAMDFFREYFGNRMASQPFGRLAVYYPLGLTVEGSEEPLLRAPMSLDERGVVKCTAEVPEGAQVRLMIGSVDRALQAARLAAMEALAQMRGRLPRLAVLFNCSARRRLFGAKAGKEIAAVSDILGPQVPLIGFYTYGEIASMEGRGSSPAFFHNETIVILTLG